MRKTCFVLLAFAVPAPGLAAQAICSAPHSSPNLAGGGSIETLPPGAGWVQASVFRQASDRFFNPLADRQVFLADGGVRTRSAYVTGSVGLVRGVDVWAQIPFHDVRFADAGGARQRTGIGDPRFSLRVGPAIAGIEGVPLAVRAGVKLPGSDFPVDATIVPLGEGQRDWEVSVESGYALRGGQVYMLGWIGRRWRELNTDFRRKPGDEWFTHLAIGASVLGVRGEIAAEYLHAEAPEVFGVTVDGARRRLFQIQPTLSHAVGPGAMDLTVLVPVSGRNLPSGAGVSAGYRLAWGH